MNKDFLYYNSLLSNLSFYTDRKNNLFIHYVRGVDLSESMKMSTFSN